MFEAFKPQISKVEVPGLDQPVYLREMTAREAWAVEIEAGNKVYPQFVLAIIACLCNEKGHRVYVFEPRADGMTFDKATADDICGWPSRAVNVIIGAIAELGDSDQEAEATEKN
jgi:hypothetical protein